MQTYGPSLVPSMHDAERSADEDRRLGHLVALADRRDARSSLLDRALARLGRRPSSVQVSALDCSAVAC